MSDDLHERQMKYCSEILKKLKKNSNAVPFLEPVDPVKLEIPDYFDKIKNPMDLSTIEKKMSKYADKDEFKADFKLMVDNCFTYNDENTYVYDAGKELERYFNNLWSKMPVKRNIHQNRTKKTRGNDKISGRTRAEMNEVDYDYAKNILNEIMKSKYKKFNWVFMEPVDVNLVPEYLDVIKNPTDLCTISANVENKIYQRREDFVDDLKTMVQNCLTFNAKGSEIYDCGLEMSKLLNSLLENSLYSIVELQRIIKNLRIKIHDLETECDEYVEILFNKLQKESRRLNEKDYSIEERAKLAECISNMDVDDTTRIAHILKKGIPDLDLENKDEVDIDFKIVPNFVLKEVEEYISFRTNNPRKKINDFDE
ncbi:SWR1 complex bromodomain subunit bdf1 [Dictyocoela muelleri]|nr:SWR1 complex bromodomain subunit bdf1 [Dictyocoela muelleri]